MTPDLVERVARAIEVDIDKAGYHDSERVARAAIAIVLEEAAKEVELLHGSFIAKNLAATIRALKGDER